ncbi:MULTISPECIES: MFS transporter [Coprobacillaceae]|uniref:MFS transporter n=1 Tax=Coprobacillaceae TaxID=2810280 RepID=UPI000E4C99FE|nr:MULTISPECIES: MFS transporter [Coprobacillaceae]RHM59544.1 MFS transporter [Coprobacillus sp. AF33-1AC]RHS91981.1 MFS transporter [Erysipelatoclostridium sp. AM42-17]
MKKLQLKFNLLYALNTVFYYAGYCIVVGYISVYLLSQGLSNTMIGIVLAMSQVLSVLLQPILIDYIEKYQNAKVKKTLLYLTGTVLIFSIILFLFNQYAIVLIGCVIFVLAIVMAMMSLMNSLAFEYQEIHIIYGVARGLGSLSYALTSLMIGYLLSVYDVSLLPLLYVIDFAFLMLILKKYHYTETVQEYHHNHHLKESTITFLKKYKFFTCFLVGIILIFFNHTFINHYLIQIIKNLGGGASHMSKAIFIASVVELPMMFLFNKINKVIKTNTLMKISVSMFFVKHLLTFLASNIAIIYVAQCVQIFAYALFIPASVYYVRDNIQSEDQLKGQALITMAMTLAGIFADLCGGILLDVLSVKTVLLIASLISLIGLSIVFVSDKIKKLDLNI